MIAKISKKSKKKSPKKYKKIKVIKENRARTKINFFFFFSLSFKRRVVIKNRGNI